MGWIDDINSKHKVVKCFESHKPLVIGGHQVYGGSCQYPVPDMDIYVGLDYSMRTHVKAYPWVNQVVAVSYLITDMQAPKDATSFKEMISWLAKNITDNKKVHIGCIGGHGRTGLVLSALVMELVGDKAAIDYVRNNYCHKAVETLVQVEFLNKHYGISKVQVFKSQNHKSTTVLKSNVVSVVPKSSVPVKSPNVNIVEFVDVPYHLWGLGVKCN